MSIDYYPLLLFLLAIPGLAFRRFYYQGEFSKQFAPKNIALVLSYSILMGGLITYTAVVFLSYLDIVPVEKERVLQFIEHYQTAKPDTLLSFLYNGPQVGHLFLFLFTTLFVSWLLAQCAFFFVRRFRLDLNFSFLRFSNHWHYYFRGHFLKFSDFKGALNSDSPAKVQMVLSDILVSEGRPEPRLYSGIITQYELFKSNGCLNLIYLTEPSRWKDREPKPITSNCFIIPYANVLNINLRVLFEERTTRRRNAFLVSIKNIYLKISPFLMLIMLFAPFFDFFGSYMISGDYAILTKLFVSFSFFTTLSFIEIYVGKKVKIGLGKLALFIVIALVLLWSIYFLLYYVFFWLG